jgi:hypothetical protein
MVRIEWVSAGIKIRGLENKAGKNFNRQDPVENNLN